MNTNLQAYADMRTRPVPPGMKPGTPFDAFDAAPIVQTPQGAVQMAGPVRQQGLVPGTLYGGLVDTRYTQGLEPQLSVTAPARPVDIDLASGVPEYTRMQQYAALRGAIDSIDARDRKMGANMGAEANAKREVGRTAKASLEQALADFLRTQQIPDQGALADEYAVGKGKGRQYRDMVRNARQAQTNPVAPSPEQVNALRNGGSAFPLRR